MTAQIDLVDDGFVTVSVRAAGGEPTAVALDLLATALRLRRALEEHRGGDDAGFLGVVADVMVELGFPRPSSAGADAFATRIFKAAAALHAGDDRPAQGEPEKAAS